MTWTPEQIQIGVNDLVYSVFGNPGDGDRTRWPFDRPQYLVLNFAMGGSLGGSVPTNFTSDQMEVVHVRVYQRWCCGTLDVQIACNTTLETADAPANCKGIAARPG